jgi:NAD(P)-dependent dehydrogenase (short-subunit alcohol dehydrogenase family)
MAGKEPARVVGRAVAREVVAVFGTAAPRRVAVTGAASGIGLALCQLLRERGDEVIGVDVQAAPSVAVVADLGSAEGRATMVKDVGKLVGTGALDAVVANAGTARYNRSTVSVNFFGAVRTLEGLRPLLLRSTTPRAAVTLSVAAMWPSRPELVARMLAGDEEGAVALAADMEKEGTAQTALLYPSSKHAMALWLRRASISPEWAGEGVPLNGVGPTVIDTPMVAPFLATPEGRKQMRELVPLPLHPGKWGKPDEVAKLLDFLVSADNSLCTGQVIFADGGYDVVLRGANVFQPVGALGTPGAKSPLEALSAFADK